MTGVAPAFAITDPPPIPQPVTDVVQQVSDVTGLPNPLPPSEGATRHHRKLTHPAPTSTTVTPTSHVQATRPPAHHPVLSVPVPALPVQMRPVALGTSVPPAIAPPTRIQPASALRALPAPSPRDDTPRILLVAIATLILGALAGGHIKAAQEFAFAH